MDYQEIVTAELMMHDIRLCTGCESYNSHSRGYAIPDDRTIHVSAKMATRKTLCKFLHEVGHIVKGHKKGCKLKRWQREDEAESYAKESMRMLGIPYPRERGRRSSGYVNRMKRWGKRISNGLKEHRQFYAMS